MTPTEPSTITLNANKGINGVGIVLAVIIGIVLAMPKPKTGAPGFEDVKLLFWFLLLLPALMILMRKSLILNPTTRQIQIKEGVWPYMRTKQVEFDESSEVTVDAGRLRSGKFYSGFISIPGHKKPFVLFADGDEDQLQTVFDFAKAAKLPIRPLKGMQTLAPDWTKRLL